MNNWRNIPDFKYYEASIWGEIRMKINKKIIPLKDTHRYKYVRLRKHIYKKNYVVHRLIANTLIPNPENKPQVNHKNGIRADNRVENLEWCTPKENRIHAIQTGLHKTIIRRISQKYICLYCGNVFYRKMKGFYCSRKCAAKLRIPHEFSEKHKEKIRNSKFKKIIQYSLSGEIIKKWNSTQSASLSLNIPACNISNVLRKRQSNTRDFIFKYDKNG